MRRLVEAWDRFWFSPQSAVDLGIARVLLFGGIFWWRYRADPAAWADIGAPFWFPIRLFSILDLPLFSAPVLETLQHVWIAAVGLAAIGLMTRVSTVVAFVLGVYLIGLPHNFGKIHHSDAAVVLILAGLALSRCGDAVSVDAWLRRRRGLPPPAPSGEYRWPVRVAWLCTVLLYFAAGVSKLRNGGAAWVFSDSFRNILLEHHYSHVPLVTWGLTIAESPFLTRALAAGTILVEILCPLALLGVAARAFFIPALALMQFGIWLMLGVRFDFYLFMLFFWIPWSALLGWARART
jgi:hypothetical protein